MVQSWLVIVDKDTGGDMHGIHQDQALLDAAFHQALLNLRRDIDEPNAGGQVEPEFFTIAFHRAGVLSCLSMHAWLVHSTVGPNHTGDNPRDSDTRRRKFHGDVSGVGRMQNGPVWVLFDAS